MIAAILVGGWIAQSVPLGLLVASAFAWATRNDRPSCGTSEGETMTQPVELSPFEADEKRRFLASVEGTIASLPRTASCGMHPAFYASDRKGFYRERDRLRADFGLPPGAPDPHLRAIMRAARAA